jgi:glycerol-3-phosphate acyltransferase PlsY
MTRHRRGTFRSFENLRPNEDHMRNLTVPLLWTLASYMLGCLNGAYYLHRLRTGRDIRTEGSGNAGARNAGRVMGRRGFAAVFLIDAGKGAVAVLAARALGLGDAGVMAAAVAVVAGHNYPVQLGFRGGRGIAAAFGAILAADLTVALISLAVAAIILLLLRRPTVSGALGMIASPLVAIVLQRTGAAILGLAFISLLGAVAFGSEVRAVWNDRLDR